MIAAEEWRYEFVGTASEFEHVLSRAHELNVRIVVDDRQTGRGLGEVLLTLLVAGAGSAVAQLVEEFATSLRARSVERRRRRER